MVYAKQATDFGHFANLDMNDMNFLANTSNFQFDPQLFGGYREPQENVLSNGFDDSFFNDAFDIDFTTPYFAASPQPPKKDLVSQIDAVKNEDQTELVPTQDGQFLTCNKIWFVSASLPQPVKLGLAANDRYREKLQNCPKVQNGDFDLDGLCSDLQKKAKCSGSGAVVDERTFKDVMKKYLGKDGGNCPDEQAQAQQTQQAQASA